MNLPAFEVALQYKHPLTVERFFRAAEEEGGEFEYADILRDLTALEAVQVRHQGKWCLLQTPLKGVCGKVLQGAGVAIPPPVSPVGEDCGAKISSRAL